MFLEIGFVVKSVDTELTFTAETRVDTSATSVSNPTISRRLPPSRAYLGGAAGQLVRGGSRSAGHHLAGKQGTAPDATVADATRARGQ